MEGIGECNEELTYDGVVVLKVASTSLSLESSPEVVLRHGVGLSRPTWEVLSVESELRLELLDRVGVVQEEDLIKAGQSLDSVTQSPETEEMKTHTVPWPALKPSSFFSV